MPCRDDYPHSPTKEDERKSFNNHVRSVATLLTWARKKLHLTSDPTLQPMLDENTIFTFDTDDADYVTAQLCGILRNPDLTDSQREELLYDAHSRESRELLIWWEDHQEEDRAREAAEEAERTEKEARDTALAKLSDADRKALGIAQDTAE